MLIFYVFGMKIHFMTRLQSQIIENNINKQDLTLQNAFLHIRIVQYQVITNKESPFDFISVRSNTVIYKHETGPPSNPSSVLCVICSEP